MNPEDGLWEEQRVIARLLTRPGAGDSDTLAASHLLARSLAVVVQDRRFWDKLRKADTNLGTTERIPLKLLVRVNWVQVLNDCGYVPPPRAGDVAWELIRDMGALTESRGNRTTAALPEGAVADLRAELETFVQRLNGELVAPEGKRTRVWWGSLRHLAGIGLEALRHINLASLLWAGGQAAAFALPPAVMAVGPAGFVAVAAAAVGGIAIAALAQLRQANQRLRDEETVRGRDAVLATMDDILNGLDGTIKQFDADNELSDAIAIVNDKAAGHVSNLYIANARKLEERLGALLPSAWTYCCVQIGYEGEHRIEDTADSNARLDEAITALEAARKNPDTGVDSSTAEIEGAAKTLADSLLKLRELLVAAGVATAKAY